MQLKVSRESISGRLFHDCEKLEKAKCSGIARAVARLFLMIVIPITALADLAVTGLSTLLIFPLYCFGPKQHLLHTATALVLFVSSPVVMAVYLLSGKFMVNLVETPFFRCPVAAPLSMIPFPILEQNNPDQSGSGAWSSNRSEVIEEMGVFAPPFEREPAAFPVAEPDVSFPIELEPAISPLAEPDPSFPMVEFQKTYGFSFTLSPITAAIADQQWSSVPGLLKQDLKRLSELITLTFPTGEKREIGLLDFMVRMMPVQRENDEAWRWYHFPSYSSSLIQTCRAFSRQRERLFG